MSRYNDDRLFPDLPISNKDYSNLFGCFQKKVINDFISCGNSFKALAKYLGVSRSCVYSWYNCKSCMSLVFYLLILLYLSNHEMSSSF